MALGGATRRQPDNRSTSAAHECASERSSSRGRVMELSDYELVRYPSGQLVLMKGGINAQGQPSGGPKDVVGVFTDEAEAQSVLARLIATHGLNDPQESQRPLRA